AAQPRPLRPHRSGRPAHREHGPHRPWTAPDRDRPAGPHPGAVPDRVHMSEDRQGRELTPREPGPEEGDSALAPVPEADSRGVERFSAGPKAHMVGLTEVRGAEIVRQSGNARNVVFLAVLVISLFIPVYWFYENGIPAIG